MESSEAVAGPVGESCPHCQAAIAQDDRNCRACQRPLLRGFGGKLIVTDPPPGPPATPREANLAKIGKARKWLFAVALLTVVFGVIFFVMQKGEVEKQIEVARAQVAGIPPDVLDERFKAATGMTFQEAIDHDRGMVNMLLAVNLVLAGIYMALWWWAKTKPLPATVIALMLFITMNVINAVIQPESLAQGWLLKIFFTLALVRAITAASEERKLAEAAPT